MLLTERERATYEGIQQALDKNQEDQMLRLMLADWYEERGREAAAECMRWLAANDMWPVSDPDDVEFWGWTRLSNDIPAYSRHRLPDYVHPHLPEYKGGRITTLDKIQPWWWEFCKCRQSAEEAAVLAWEKWWRVR